MRSLAMFVERHTCKADPRLVVILRLKDLLGPVTRVKKKKIVGWRPRWGPRRPWWWWPMSTPRWRARSDGSGGKETDSDKDERARDGSGGDTDSDKEETQTQTKIHTDINVERRARTCGDQGERLV